MTPTALRATLAALGLTQAEAAHMLGVDERTIRRWLAGERKIPEPAARLLGLIEAYPVFTRSWLSRLE